MTEEQLAFYAEQFERCWPLLEAAVKAYGDTHSKEHVWQQIATGKAQLWPLPNAAIVSQIDEYETGLKEIRAWLAGGDLDELSAFSPTIEDWGRVNNCTRMTIVGRRGWLRALPGYHDVSTVMAKEL